MSAHTRRELLDVLTELGLRYPDWRFGQLVANVAGWADVDQWDAEDDKLLAAAQSHLRSAAPEGEPVVPNANAR